MVVKDLEAAPASARHASSGSTAPATPVRRDSIIDYLLLLARYRADAADGKVNGHGLDIPEELVKFKQATESGVSNAARAKYARRGMKNDHNNCYVNVVIQSLLPCSALMQLLSHCSPGDPDRPFYTAMVRLCKEFHGRRAPDSHSGEAFNVVLLPQVKSIINNWQAIGAQQDAGEFLFHILNGMHEECKWQALASAPSFSSASTAEGRSCGSSGGGDQSTGSGGAEGEAGEGASAEGAESADQAGEGAAGTRSVEVRSAGEQEDSPIVRIFGGLIRSSVRSNDDDGADSVSLEPFNHLILDISAPSVDSVWSALEAYCGAEAVNEGQATKRLQFKMVPKVLILSLKRFSYNKDTLCPQKMRKAIKFEEKLTFDRRWVVDGVEPQEYHLTAVICHHGESVNGGHYTAAVRYNSEWYLYDDIVVRQISLTEVLSQHYTAYILLYQCHDKVDIRP